MRRRRLLNLLTALSLLLCVAVAVLWVRSYLISDWVGCRRVVDGGGGGIDWTWLAGRGIAQLTRSAYTWEAPLRTTGADGAAEWEWERQPADDVATIWPDESILGRLGVRWNVERTSAPSGFSQRTRVVQFRLWMVAVLFAILPAGRLYRHLRLRCPARLCATCGYDLRATPGRCPECGTEATPSA